MQVTVWDTYVTRQTGMITIVFTIFILSSCSNPQKPENTEIIWDNYGVPHVYANNEAEMYYAFGWTHTVNTIDASDRYELTLQEGGYLLDGKSVPFQEKRVPLKVLQKDGTVQQLDIELRYSKHEPVMGEKDNKAYAVRVAGLENSSYYAQYHEMGKAKNMKEFEDALKMMQIPMFNLIYADKESNILYLFNGNVPVRSEGDWVFWNGTVDGTQSKYIWNSGIELPM